MVVCPLPTVNAVCGDGHCDLVDSITDFRWIDRVSEKFFWDTNCDFEKFSPPTARGHRIFDIENARF